MTISQIIEGSVATPGLPLVGLVILLIGILLGNTILIKINHKGILITVAIFPASILTLNYHCLFPFLVAKPNKLTAK